MNKEIKPENQENESENNQDTMPQNQQSNDQNQESMKENEPGNNQDTMPQDQQSNDQNQENIDITSSTNVEPSSRRRRFFAHFFDSIILSIVINISFHLMPINMSFKGAEHLSLITFAITFCYFSFFPITPWWCTPGQKLLGIYICKTKDCTQISPLMSSIRVFLFYALWIISFVTSAFFFVGSDINEIKNVLKKGAQQKKSIQFDGRMFYREKPTLVSFTDTKTNKKIHFLNVLGKNTVIIEDSTHQLSLNHGGEEIASSFYDEKISNTSSFVHSTSNDDFASLIGKIFKTFIKLIGSAILLFTLILVIPTMLNPHKQTLYDMICGVFVARRKT